MMKKLGTLAGMLAVVSPALHAEGTAYFTLPTDFQASAIATLTGVIAVLLAIRVFPVMWKYLVQFFGKRGA